MSEKQLEIKEESVTIALSTTDRFERGLDGLQKGREYKFKPNGRIDYRAMISPEWLVINRQFTAKIEQKYGKSINELLITDVGDEFLLIKLGGIKELAELRGVSDYSTDIKYGPNGQVCAVARITWIPNFETNNDFVSFSGVGAASVENTSNFGKLYLETIAENRAFVRAVRNFLGINIVGQDEIKPEATQATQTETQTAAAPNTAAFLLETKAKEKFANFGQFCRWVTEEKMFDLSKMNWNSYGDIKTQDALALLSEVKKLPST